MRIAVAPHPLLDVGAFVMRLRLPLAELVTPPAVLDALGPGATAPLTTSDAVRADVRALLRHGGFKPAGRSKPASEYLVAAAAEGAFPRINAAVDTCNAVSLHSGLPISLVDLDRLASSADAERAAAPQAVRSVIDGALAIGVLAPGTSYVFNPSGQTIDAGGLLALSDALGPSGTPVKDAQRTKTHAETRTALAIVWGTHALPGRTAQATAWYRELTAAIGAVEDVELR